MPQQIESQGKIVLGGFSRILIHIYSSRMTGTVGLSRGEVKKVISFSIGKPVSSRSNIVKESLGQLLIQKGKITEGQLSEFLAELKANDGIHMGGLLVSKGIITPVELEGFLKFQLTERLKRVIFWDSGDYKIVEGKLAETSLINLEKEIPEIIFEAASSPEHYQAVREIISCDAVPVRTGGGSAIRLEDIKIGGRAMSVLRFVNGTNNVSKIMADSKIDEKMVLSSLYALENIGLLAIRVERAAAAREPQPQETKSAPQTAPEGQKERDLPEESQQLLLDIRALAEKVEERDYFGYFDLARDASQDDLKNNYFSFARNFHPDRFPKEFTPEMKREGEKLFAVITEAYNVILDPKKREEYIAKIDLEAQGVTINPNRVAESEFEFQKGQILLKKADFEGAIEMFKRAIALYPEEAEYYIGLGWALHRKGVRTRDASMIVNAKMEIERGLAINPSSDKGHLYLGHIAKHEGKMEAARKSYQRALEVNPNCLEASSELRLIQGKSARN